MLKNNTISIKGADERTGQIKSIVCLLIVIILLLVSILAGILIGSTDLSASTVFDVLKLKLFGIENSSLTSSSTYIIWNLRLPRAILAIAAGGGLAICGAAMQAITQNVLAEPYILGVSSGASAMVSLAFFLGGFFMNSALITQLFAFCGALFAMALVYSVGVVKNGSSNTRLVLAGMAVSIILNAVSQFCITMSSAQTSRSISMWMMGSLAEARWENIAIPLVASLVGLCFFCANARAYDLISLGDETAISMGVNTVSLKKWSMLMVAFVTGVIVSCCGIIGLVGFVVPHTVRLLVGSNHRRLLPLSFLVGCVFLVWMDVLARYVMAPQEVPIGIFTAFCGGPFFIWLLYRQNHTVQG